MYIMMMVRVYYTAILALAVSIRGISHQLCTYNVYKCSINFGGSFKVLVVLWAIGTEITTANPSTISGHTALPRTTTYQEVVVDNYTNLAAEYCCTPTLSNGSQLLSNRYNPQYECECFPNPINLILLCAQVHMPVRRWRK